MVSFELVHLELNGFPGILLSPSAKDMIWIGLQFWNQALMHLPYTFSSEFLSVLNCKVDLIHANMNSIISCSWKGCSGPYYYAPHVPSPSFPPPLGTIPVPLQANWTPCSRGYPPPPHTSPDVPCSPQLTYPWLCLPLCSASFKLLWFAFLTSGSCSHFPAVRPLGYLYHCHGTVKASLELRGGEFWGLWCIPNKVMLPIKPTKTPKRTTWRFQSMHGILQTAFCPSSWVGQTSLWGKWHR